VRVLVALAISVGDALGRSVAVVVGALRVGLEVRVAARVRARAPNAGVANTLTHARATQSALPICVGKFRDGIENAMKRVTRRQR
jgi:hypothetical protein